MRNDRVDETAARVGYVDASACGHLSDALGLWNQEDSQYGFPHSSQPGGSLPEVAAKLRPPRRRHVRKGEGASRSPGLLRSLRGQRRWRISRFRSCQKNFREMLKPRNQSLV